MKTTNNEEKVMTLEKKDGKKSANETSRKWGKEIASGMSGTSPRNDIKKGIASPLSGTSARSDIKINDLGRRAFLKVCGALGLGVPMALVAGGDGKNLLKYREAAAGPPQPPRESYWNEAGYFVHSNVDASDWEQGVVRARTDGEWKEYHVRHLENGFLNWNFAARTDVLTDPMSMMCLDGPHSAALATYGANRGDSNFSINVAFKGFGFVPHADYIDEAIDTVTSNWSASLTAKAGILLDFYANRDMWDTRMLGSLELYTTPIFETHSFLNQMANPQVAVCWLAIPGSYEVRAIPRLIHPYDPEVPEDDWKRVRWINMIHDFYHGGPYPSSPGNIAVIYYIVEEFDNSPYPGPMGIRRVPAL